MIVPKDASDPRPVGFGASSSNGYFMYRGNDPRSNFGNIEVGGPYTTWEEGIAAHPDINFSTKQVCGICGGTTPCLRED